MKYSSILVGAFLSSALLAACGGNHTLASPNSFLPAAGAPLSVDAGVEKVLYRFAGGKDDGSLPVGGLLDVNGELYGTTEFGGASTCANSLSPVGCGTVFKIDPDPTGSSYKVVYKFPENASGGALPLAGLTYAGGWLYGTTDWGGSAMGCNGNTGCGSIFRIEASNNRFQKLYAFNGNDGLAVFAGVIDGNQKLYGATGGAFAGGGALYSLSGNTLTRLHVFGGGNDGAAPLVAPIDVNGTLYGTAAAGGGGSCTGGFGNGCGIIYAFRIKPPSYHILHIFNGKDGAFPANVIDVNGTLYGTTGAGGNTGCQSPSLPKGCGIVFKISTRGTGFRVLHRFAPGKDGYSPVSVIYSAGKLYSADTFGGEAGCGLPSGGTGCGTVFQMDTSTGGFSVLYRFKGGTDGANPASYGPIELNGKLYGTTGWGGGTGCGGLGCGTVFEVTPL